MAVIGWPWQNSRAAVMMAATIFGGRLRRVVVDGYGSGALLAHHPAEARDDGYYNHYVIH